MSILKSMWFKLVIVIVTLLVVMAFVSLADAVEPRANCVSSIAYSEELPDGTTLTQTWDLISYKKSFATGSWVLHCKYLLTSSVEAEPRAWCVNSITRREVDAGGGVLTQTWVLTSSRQTEGWVMKCNYGLIEVYGDPQPTAQK